MSVTDVPRARRRRRARGPARRFSVGDRVVISVFIWVPAVLVAMLIWGAALAAIVLSFSSWDGIGGFSSLKWIGWDNYSNIFTNYPPFWPALGHNLAWLMVFSVIAAPLGLFFAVLIDSGFKGALFYESALFLPVMLSTALIGIIWQLIYSPDEGLINGLLGTAGSPEAIDWLGNPRVNLWATLVAACWRQIGYVMILYLAGLKGVDSTIKEAAVMDGCNAWQVFRHATFPSLAPLSVVVLVVTVIESLRSFDLVYIINGGTNGLELISALVTTTTIGEASRIGYGSALGTILLVLSLVPISVFLLQSFKRKVV